MLGAGFATGQTASPMVTAATMCYFSDVECKAADADQCVTTQAAWAAACKLHPSCTATYKKCVGNCWSGGGAEPAKEGGGTTYIALGVSLSIGGLVLLYAVCYQSAKRKKRNHTMLHNMNAVYEDPGLDNALPW